MSARLPDRDRMLRLVTERQLQRQVEGILTVYGWRWYHGADNRPVNGRVQRVVPGFPDILATRGSRILAAELKTETGRVADEQLAWLADLEAAGVEIHIWRPRDIDTITRTLAR